MISTTLGVLGGDTEQAAGGLGGPPPNRLRTGGRCWFSASRTDAMIFAFGRKLPRCQRDQHGGRVVVGRDDDRLGVLSPANRKDIGLVGVSQNGDQTRRVRAVQRRLIRVDDDDLGRYRAIAEHRRDGRLALGSVSDDDGVVFVFLHRWILRAWRDAVVRSPRWYRPRRSGTPPAGVIQNVHQASCLGVRVMSRSRSWKVRPWRSRGNPGMSADHPDVAVSVLIEIDDDHRCEQRAERVQNLPRDARPGLTNLSGMCRYSTSALSGFAVGSRPSPRRRRNLPFGHEHNVHVAQHRRAVPHPSQAPGLPDGRHADRNGVTHSAGTQALRHHRSRRIAWPPPTRPA